MGVIGIQVHPDFETKMRHFYEIFDLFDLGGNSRSEEIEDDLHETPLGLWYSIITDFPELDLLTQNRVVGEELARLSSEMRKDYQDILWAPSTEHLVKFYITLNPDAEDVLTDLIEFAASGYFIFHKDRTGKISTSNTQG
jgi:hypothetical protein